MVRIRTIKVSVGIFCHNEESNIARAITSVLQSHTIHAQIREIVVVSSGSFDRTNAIVRAYEKKDKRVKLVEEVERHGKSSAINLFVRSVHGDVLVSLSGDLKVHKDAIEEMTTPFLNPEVGMAGAHPVPTNCRFSSVGREMALLWELHHRISLMRPKCGEMVAFRNVIRKIPATSAVDEANLEVLLKMIGFSVVYVPRAIVYNRVPATLGDLLVQRRRVEAGHLWLSSHYNYQVVTMEYEKLLSVLWQYFLEHPRDIVTLFRLLFIEAISRGLGWLDYRVLGKNPFVWQMVKR